MEAERQVRKTESEKQRTCITRHVERQVEAERQVRKTKNEKQRT